MSTISLAAMFLELAGRYGPKEAFRSKRGKRWEGMSWKTFGDRITLAARGLAMRGFRAGDRLAILAENRPEWAVIDLACLFLGGVDVPLYLTSSRREMLSILKDADVTHVAVSGTEQLARILEIAENLPRLSQLYLLDDGPKEEIRLGKLAAIGIAGLFAQGEGGGGAFEPVADPGLATIIYTSGTTGQPKGVMLSHANLLANSRDATQVLPIGEEDLALSFLPLSHAFERTAGLYSVLRAGARIAYGGGVLSLANDLKEVGPTLICCAPRALDFIYRRIWSEREKAGLLRRAVLDRALRVGKAAGALRAGGQPLPFFLGLEHRLLDRIVFRRLRALLGGRMRFLISGGAPLSVEVARFFHGAGVPVYEGYGLTEAGPVVSCNRPGRTRLGTVGQPLPQVEVKIDPAGEICVRGPSIMQGYCNRPEETAQTFDAEGWLRTGDVGQIDAEGYIIVTDRKKELIITSDGENIAPLYIEGLLKQDPLIEEVCLIGDMRPYLTVLIAPNRALLEALARRRGISDPWPATLGKKEFRALFRRRLDEVNKSLPRHARVRDFALLDAPFSQEREELTPTLKVKRKIVAETRRAEIEALYRSGREIGTP